MHTPAPKAWKPLAPTLMLLAAANPLAAAPPSGHPPAGQYRIDSESVTTTPTMIGPMKSTQRVDGATGRTTVISETPSVPASTNVVNGDGPQTWCVPDFSIPPAKALKRACPANSYSATSGGSTLATDCAGVKFDEQWRRIDDRTWERVMHSNYFTSTMSGDSPARAMEFVMAGMSPEERARARTELAKLPKPGDTAAAMAPVIAQLEEQTRTGSPSDAAMAKEQLAAIKGRGGAPDITVDLRERWTRIAEVCTPTR